MCTILLRQQPTTVGRVTPIAIRALKTIANNGGITNKTNVSSQY